MEKNKSNLASSAVRIIVILAILAGGYFLYQWLDNGSSPLTHSDEIPPATGFILDDEPVIQKITRWHREEHLDIEEINRRLPDSFELIVLNEDINADDQPNYLLIHRDGDLPDLSSALTNVGFTHVFRDLTVYEARNNKLVPLLTIDHQAIRNSAGDQLIDQVVAQNGYAMLLETYEHGDLYDKPVQLIEIVMIDRSGREISDEIVIYWDPSESAFKATNTFGAP